MLANSCPHEATQSSISIHFKGPPGSADSLFGSVLVSTDSLGEMCLQELNAPPAANVANVFRLQFDAGQLVHGAFIRVY